MWFILIATIVAAFIYFKIIKSPTRWQDKGVPHLQPWPIFGNMGPYVLGKRSFTEMVVDLYNAFPEKRYVGVYQFRAPVLFIRDPELIKRITVKDFDSFPDRRTYGSKDTDPLWTRNLLSLTSKDGWHNMRATLSPSFTSSKLRGMFILIQQCATNFSSHFYQQGRLVDVEVLDAFTRFTSNVIATTAFGITCDSLKDPDNTFFAMGKDATNYSGLRTLKFFGHSICPALMNILKVKIYDERISSFFRTLIKDSITMRKEKKIVRPDMIHLLMEAQKGRLKYDDQSNITDSEFAVVEESDIGKTQRGQKPELSDDDIVAQSLLFFKAGFDGVARLMSYATYELALNPDIQKKLQREVDVATEKCNGKLTYEALSGMKYLDMIISETLRKRPIGIFTERQSTKPFTIDPERPGEEPVHLESGTFVWIPVYPLHNDSKYYDNPEKFDPERFSDNNKHKVKPFTYLPFGAGPRNCLASRFALLESKLIIAEVVRKFEIVPIEKTQIPIQLSKKNFNPVPDEGIWLGFRSRSLSL